MKRHTSLFIFFLLFLSNALAKVTAPKDMSDTQLLTEAAEASWSIDDAPEKLALIEACGKWDPALAEYAAWRRKGELDIKEERGREALTRLLNIAASLPQEQEDVRIATARINYLRSEKMWNQTERNKAIELLKSMTATLEGCSSPEATNLKILCRMAMCLMQREEEGDSPLFWDKACTLEQEFLDLLAGKHTEDIVLYRAMDIMFYLKSISTSYVTYYNYVFGNANLEGRGIMPDTRDQDFINSNSLWYYGEAMRIISKISGADICDAASTVFSKAVYVYNHHLRKHYEATLQDICNMQQKLRQKGTRGLPFLEMLEPWKALYEIRTGKEVTFTKDWRRSANTICLFYGSDSNEFHDFNANMSTVMYEQGKYEELAAVEQYIKETEKEMKENTPEKELKSEVESLWETQAGMSDQEFRNYVQSLTQKYLSSHKPQWSSIEIGKSLASRLYLEMMDKEAALKVHEAATQDILQLLPENHLQILQEYDELTNYITDSYSNSYKEYLRLKEKFVEKHDVHSPRALWNIAINNLNIGNTQRAMELYGRAVTEAKKEGKKIMEACIAIEMAPYSNDRNEARKLVDKYYGVLLNTPDYQYIVMNALSNAANFYIADGNTERPFALYEKGRQLIISSNLPTTSDNVRFYTEYVEIITSFRNDYDAGLQLLEEMIALYGNMNTENGYGQDMMELQKKRFDLISMKGNSMDVILKKMLCMREMMAIAGRMYQLSGESDDIRFTYLVDAMCRVDFLFHLYNEVKRNMAGMKENMRGYDQMVTFKNTLEENMKDISAEKFDSILKDFRSYDPNYLQNDRYYSLLTTAATYYVNVKDDFAKAEELLKQQLDGTKKHYNSLYPTYLNSYVNFLIGTNRYEEAERSLKEYEEQMADGITSLDVRIAQTSAKYHIFHHLRKYEECIAPAKENLTLMKELIDINFDLLTQQDREAILTEKGTGAGHIVHLLERFPKELAATAYDAMLHEKNLLLRSSERIRRSVMKSKDENLMAALDTIAFLQGKMKEKVGFGMGSTMEQQKEFEEMLRHMEELERYVARNSRQYRDNERMQTTWNDVRKNLGKGEAAIEIVLSETKLGMLIVSTDYRQPVFVALTDKDKLYEDMEQLSELSTREYTEALYVKDRLKLYERLWKPAEEYLNGIKTIFLSPTAMTNAIAFNAIKTPDGKALMDHYDIHLLTTTAFVAMPEKKREKTFSAALFGGICYDETQANEDSHQERKDIVRNAHRGADGEAFCYLDGTLQETNGISGLMESKGTIAKHSGQKATEQTFCSLSGNSPYVIHLATHGFFITTPEQVDECPYLNRYPSSKYHSMQRCGLAFANANDAWMGDTSRELNNDGILNANEISSLDLTGTRLVTLSACETALGNYGTDGVYGLQRGLKQAGAQSIMASLWSVDDQSTSLFMTTFYSEWMKGEQLHNSLRKATMTVRNKYPSPYHWAAFILLDETE